MARDKQMDKKDRHDNRVIPVFEMFNLKTNL